MIYMRTVGGSMKEVSEARNPSSLFFLLPFLLALRSSSMSAFLISILLPLSLSPSVILNPHLRTAVWKKNTQSKVRTDLTYVTLAPESRCDYMEQFSRQLVPQRLLQLVWQNTSNWTVGYTPQWYIHATCVAWTSCRENCSVSTISVRHVRTVIFHQYIKFSLLLRGSY